MSAPHHNRHRINDVAHRFYGDVRVFDSQDTISRAILNDQEWEPYVAVPMAQAIIPGTDFLDIGANLGFSSLGVVKHGARPSRIHCFEPQPDVFEILRHNVRGLPASTYAFGLGASSDAHSYHVDPTNIGGTALSDPVIGDHVFVATLSLDQLLAQDFFPRHVSVVKIDVEGHEDQVLCGGARFLIQHRPEMFIEIQPACVEHAHRQLVDVYGYDLVVAHSVADFHFRAREKSRPAPGPLPVEAKDLPLLSLVMIVRDEAHGILDTLNSFLPYVDQVCILDTGSTDGTQSVIVKRLEEWGGDFSPTGKWALHAGDFVDFSTARNRALDLCKPTTFTIMPDADDRLAGGSELREFLKARETRPPGNEVHEGYLVNMFWGGDVGDFYLPLVLRQAARWRYTGKVHECVGGSRLPDTRIPAAKISKHVPVKSAEATKKRFSRDLDLLQSEVDADPNNVRAWFYLAQTLECLGRQAEALRAYDTRILKRGLAWDEETFEAMLRRARIMKVLNTPWALVTEAFLEAHAFAPTRAEPLFAIAEHYYAAGNWPLAYLYGTRAAALPMPTATLMVNRAVYEWKAADLVAIAAHYLARATDMSVHATGKAYADKALAANPNDLRMQANRAFYAQSAHTVFGAVHHELDFHPEAPYVATNPSIHFDGVQLRCLVRTTNYKIVDGNYITPQDNVIFTRNWMLELDTDSLEIRRTTPMVDADSNSRSSFPVHGFEDCRLFSVRDRLYATATVCDFDGEAGTREIVKLTILKDADPPLGDYTISRATPIRGPWSSHPQKNWMPLATQSWERPARAIYSCDPPRILDISSATHSYNREGADQYALTSRLRGGSQLVQWRYGEFLSTRYICLVHEVSFLGDRNRIYLHRFVEFCDLSDGSGGMRITAMTEPFYFHNHGIEFAAGLTYLRGEREAEDRLVASYGANDCKAFLAVFAARKVLEQLVAVK